LLRHSGILTFYEFVIPDEIIWRIEIMNEVVIANYLRTAQTRSRPSNPERDWFYQLRADDLLAQLIPALLKQAKVGSNEIDDLIVGSALGVSEQWTFGGRTPVLLAGMDTRAGR